MRLFKSIRRRIVRGIRRNADLIALWVALVALVPYIRPEWPVARNDLVPWTMACLSAVAFVRGENLGQGAHRMLTRQKSSLGRWFQRGALVAAPLALIFWFDFGRESRNWDLARFNLGVAAAITVGIGVALILGRKEGRTAWNPRGVPGWLIWGLGLLGLIGSAVSIGYVEGLVEQFSPDRPLGRGRYFPGDVLLLGVGFLAVGTISGRVQHLRQRLAARLKDGSPYRPKMFPYLFASLGSIVGMGLLYFLQEFFRIGVNMGFSEASIPAAFVVAWAAVVWPPRTPIAVTCLLHEVMPTGGGDSYVENTANPFESPPEGALRLNPLKIRRVRSLHPWLVPVKASRIDELDDPIRPLWQRREPPLSYHILGGASFESDDLTNQEQWERITVRLKGQDDTSSLKSSAAAARRMVVLRPFLEPGESRKSQLKTYTWDQTVPDATIQVVDANTEKLTLTDGCVIVLSTEGVARAFELEIGAPVYELNEVVGFRPPQLEDYVKV